MKNRRSFLRLAGMAFCGIGTTGVLHAEPFVPTGRRGLTFFGAAGRVSGSMALLTLPATKLIIDCGSFYDEIGDSSSLNAEMPAEALDASMLLLTHVHTDHVGRIPLLIKRGFKGQIAATEATLNMLGVMLAMGARYSDDPNRKWFWSARRNASAGQIERFTLHWHLGCKWLKRIIPGNLRSHQGDWRQLKDRIWRDKADASPCKECAKLDVEPIMQRCRSFPTDKPFRVGEDTLVTPVEAGHLPGSVALHIDSKWDDNKRRRILFSGDLGPCRPMLQRGFGKTPVADMVVVECTYGADRPASTRDSELRRFRESLLRALTRKEIVWIPCFALDRTEKVLMQVEVALREGGDKLDRLPEVFVPSPSANEFHDLYRRGGESWGLRPEYLALGGRTRRAEGSGFQRQMPTEVREFLDAAKARDMGLPGFPDPVPLAGKAFDSLAGNIILTTSGMISEAFSEELFKPLARMEKTSIFLVGYQDPKSTGGMLKTAVKGGRKTLEIDGEECEVNANVEDFKGFSGHAHAGEIDQWLEPQKRGSKLMLVHGESQNLALRKKDLESQGWRDIQIPDHGQHFSL